MTLHINADSLRKFYKDVLLAAGVRKCDADIVAEGVLYADVHGFDSHGMANFVRIYMAMIAAGEVDIEAAPEVVAELGGLASVDGNNALGFAVGHFAMSHAIERARTHGIAAVGVRNSSHAGCMGFFAKLARDAGMVGLAFTNLGNQAMLCPPGGAVPMVGTNVLAAAAPSANEATFALDMSTSVVSAGRVRLAERRNESIPAGWLVKRDGEPSVDPGDLDRGLATLSFLGGRPDTGAYKGFGLALLIDILSGLMANGSVGPKKVSAEERTGRKDKNIGHFFIAINPLDASFSTRVGNMLEAVKTCPTAPRSERVTYPGLVEAETAKARRSGGIPVQAEMLDQLNHLATRYNVKPLAGAKES